MYRSQCVQIASQYVVSDEIWTKGHCIPERILRVLNSSKRVLLLESESALPAMSLLVSLRCIPAHYHFIKDVVRALVPGLESKMPQ